MTFYKLGLRDALSFYKVAVVAKPVKDYRRSLQALSGGTSFHGTASENLSPILTSGKLIPGSSNIFSPLGVKEVYLSTDRPPSVHPNPDLPPRGPRALFGVPTSQILSDTAAARLIDAPRSTRPGAPTHWTLTPNEVPLKPKNLLIGAPSADTQRLRLRTLDPDRFGDALKKLHPGATY